LLVSQLLPSLSTDNGKFSFAVLYLCKFFLMFNYFYLKLYSKQAVQALAKTEEGERRAYKIDFSAVEMTDLIGSGALLFFKFFYFWVFTHNQDLLGTYTEDCTEVQTSPLRSSSSRIWTKSNSENLLMKLPSW
jgi:hypothetical protein